MRVVLAGVMIMFGSMAFAVVTPNDFKEGSDSDRIEAAIAKAVEGGERSIEIPRMNAQSGQPLWLVERAIMLPSDFTLVLRDCTVELAPGVQDNLIRNEGTLKEPMEGNRNIRILGYGNALLSGGKKSHFDPPGDRSGWQTIGILLYGVEYFTIDGFSMGETQAWAISVEHGCAYGRISNLAFNSSNKMPNQDGVDIRKGCHDILIENITGATGDDTVALTGLRSDKPPTPGRKPMQIGGRSPTENDDIYNITIRNVIAKCTGGHGIIRLLNQDGVRMYNITIRDVVDSSTSSERRVHSAIRVGDTNYSSIKRSEMGEMFNIVIDNVVSRGRSVVLIKGPLCDSTITNIRGFDGCTKMVDVQAELKRVVFDAPAEE